MRKRQRNPVVITNVFHLAKVGGEGSNPFTRSKFSYINSLLRSPLFWVCACIYAGFATFIHL